MRFWTMLLGLAVAAALVSNVSAQDETKKKKRGGGYQQATFEEMDTNKDGKLSKEEFVTARMKNVPEDRKEKSKERVEATWKTIAGDKAEVNKEEFEAGMKKVMEEFKNRKKGG
jgi:hypothetical protein